MDIEKLILELKQELTKVLGANLKNLQPALKEDLNNYFKESEEKLKRWTLLLESKAITLEEFQWLLKSEQEIVVLHALQAAGLSKIKLNNIKKSIATTIFKVVIASI